jgi:hypothetical protein
MAPWEYAKFRDADDRKRARHGDGGRRVVIVSTVKEPFRDAPLESSASFQAFLFQLAIGFASTPTDHQARRLRR